MLPHYDDKTYAEFIRHVQLSRSGLNTRQHVCIASAAPQALTYNDVAPQAFSGDPKDVHLEPASQTYMQYILPSNYSVFDAMQPLHKFQNVPLQVVVRIKELCIALAGLIKFSMRFALYTQENVDLVQISDWKAFVPGDEFDEFVFEIDQSLFEQRVMLVLVFERPFGTGRDTFYDLFEQSTQDNFAARDLLFNFGLNSSYTSAQCEAIFYNQRAEHRFGGARQLAYIAYAEFQFSAAFWNMERVKLDFCITRPKVKTQATQDIISASLTDHKADQIPIRINGDWQLANLVAQRGAKPVILDKLYNSATSISFGGPTIRHTFIEDKVQEKLKGFTHIVPTLLRNSYVGWQQCCKPQNIIRIRVAKLELLSTENSRSAHFYLIFSIFGAPAASRLLCKNGQMVSHVVSEVVTLDRIPQFTSGFSVVLDSDQPSDIVLNISLFQIPGERDARQLRQHTRENNFGLYGQEIASACISLVDKKLRVQNAVDNLDAIVLTSHAAIQIAKICASFDFSITTFEEASASEDTILPTHILANMWLLHSKILHGQEIDYCAATSAHIVEIQRRHFSTLLRNCYLLYLNIVFDHICWTLQQDQHRAQHCDEYQAAILLLFQLLRRFEGNQADTFAFQYQIRQVFCDLSSRYKENRTFSSLMARLFLFSDKTAFIQTAGNPASQRSFQAELQIPNQQFIFLIQNVKFRFSSIESFYKHADCFVRNKQRLVKQNYLDFVIFGSQLVLQIDIPTAPEELRQDIVRFYRLILSESAFNRHLMADSQAIDLVALSLSYYLSGASDINLWASVLEFPEGSQQMLRYYSGIVLRLGKRILQYLLPESSQRGGAKNVDCSVKQCMVQNFITDEFLRLNFKLLQQESIFQQSFFYEYLVSFTQFLEQFVIYFLQFDNIDEGLQPQCDIIYQILSRIVSAYMEQTVVQEIVARYGLFQNLLCCYVYFINCALATQVSLIIRQVHIRFLISACMHAFANGFSVAFQASAAQQAFIRSKGNPRAAYEELILQDYFWAPNVVLQCAVCDQVQQKQYKQAQLTIMNLLINDILHMAKYYFQQRLCLKNLMEMQVVDSLVQLTQFKYIDIRSVTVILALLYAQTDLILRRISSQFEGKIFGRSKEIEQSLSQIDYFMNRQLFLDATKQVWFILVKYYATEIPQVLQLIHLLIFYDYVVFYEKGEFDLTFTMAYSVIYSNNEKFYDQADKFAIDRQLDRLISPLIQFSAYYPHKIDNSRAESTFTGALIQFMLNMKNVLEQTLKQTRDAIQKINGKPYTDLPRLFESYIASIQLYDQRYEIGIEQYTRIFQKLEEEKICVESAFWYLRAALFVSQFTTLPATQDLLFLSYAGGADQALLQEYLQRYEIPLCYAVYGLVRQLVPGSIGNKVAKECSQDDDKYRQLIIYLKSAQKLFQRLQMDWFYVQIDIFLTQLCEDTQVVQEPLALADEMSPMPAYKDKDTYYLIVLHGQYISDAFNDKLYIYHYKNNTRIQDVQEWFKNYYGQSYYQTLTQKSFPLQQEDIVVDIMGEYDFRNRIQTMMPSTQAQSSLISSQASSAYAPRGNNKNSIKTSPQLTRTRESLESLIPSSKSTQYAIISTQTQGIIKSHYMHKKRLYGSKLYISIMTVQPFVFYSDEEEFIEKSMTSRLVQSKVSAVLGLRQFLLSDKADIMAQFNYRYKFAGVRCFAKQPVLTNNHVFFTSQKYPATGKEDDPETKGQIVAYYILAQPLPGVNLRQEVAQEILIYYPPMIVQARYVYEQAQRLRGFVNTPDAPAQRANQIQSCLVSIFHSNVSLGSRKFYDLFATKFQSSQLEDQISISMSSSQHVQTDEDFVLFEECQQQFGNVLRPNLSSGQQYAVFQRAVSFLVDAIAECMTVLQDLLRQNPGLKDMFWSVYQNLLRETENATSSVRRWHLRSVQ